MNIKSTPLMVGDWDKVSFIKAGKKRLLVVSRLKKGPCTPKQLSMELDILMPNVSTTLSELREQGLVKNLTPKKRKGKMYALTARGERALSTIYELTRSRKKPKRR